MIDTAPADALNTRELDNHCFEVATQLVTHALPNLSNRERVEVTLNIADPLFKLVLAAYNKIHGIPPAATAATGKAAAKAPAKPRVRRTKAQLAAAAAAGTMAGGAVPVPPAPSFVPPPPAGGAAPQPLPFGV